MLKDTHFNYIGSFYQIICMPYRWCLMRVEGSAKEESQ